MFEKRGVAVSTLRCPLREPLLWIPDPASARFFLVSTLPPPSPSPFACCCQIPAILPSETEDDTEERRECGMSGCLPPSGFDSLGLRRDCRESRSLLPLRLRLFERSWGKPLVEKGSVKEDKQEGKDKDVRSSIRTFDHGISSAVCRPLCSQGGGAMSHGSVNVTSKPLSPGKRGSMRTKRESGRGVEGKLDRGGREIGVRSCVDAVLPSFECCRRVARDEIVANVRRPSAREKSPFAVGPELPFDSPRTSEKRGGSVGSGASQSSRLAKQVVDVSVQEKDKEEEKKKLVVQRGTKGEKKKKIEHNSHNVKI